MKYRNTHSLYSFIASHLRVRNGLSRRSFVGPVLRVEIKPNHAHFVISWGGGGGGGGEGFQLKTPHEHHEHFTRENPLPLPWVVHSVSRYYTIVVVVRPMGELVLYHWRIRARVLSVHTVETLGTHQDRCPLRLFAGSFPWAQQASVGTRWGETAARTASGPCSRPPEHQRSED